MNTSSRPLVPQLLTAPDGIALTAEEMAAQRRRIADLERQNAELREAIAALMQPSPSEVLPQNRLHPSRQT